MQGERTFNYRLAVTADSTPQLAQRLSAFREGQPDPGIVSGITPGGDPPKVAFLFTGQGSQSPGMARALYQTQPVFREALERCSAMLQPYLGRSILSLILGEGPESAALLDHTSYTQPALFAVEMALVALWRSWGSQALCCSWTQCGGLCRRMYGWNF